MAGHFALTLGKTPRNPPVEVHSKWSGQRDVEALASEAAVSNE